MIGPDAENFKKIKNEMLLENKVSMEGTVDNVRPMHWQRYVCGFLLGSAIGLFGGYFWAQTHYRPARVVAEDLTQQTMKYQKKDLVVITGSGNRYAFIQSEKGYYQPVEQYLRFQRQPLESQISTSEELIKRRIQEAK